MKTPSEYAKSIGWRSLTECERYLKLGKCTLSRMSVRDPLKFRSLVRGAWLEWSEAKNEH